MPNDPLEGEILPDDRQLPAAPALPAELHLLPLTEKPFFPAQTLPLPVLGGEAEAVAAHQLLEHPHRRLGHLDADPVTRHHCDLDAVRA